MSYAYCVIDGSDVGRDHTMYHVYEDREAKALKSSCFRTVAEAREATRQLNELFEFYHVKHVGIVAKAAIFATHAHLGQRRKYTLEPYVYHCAEVADIIREAGFHEMVQAAAWLHDVLEDTPVTRERLEQEFGLAVTSWVIELTDEDIEGNRRTRTASHRARLATASYTAQSIKYADLISNTRSIVERDPGFARVYMREKRELLDVMNRGYKLLFDRALKLVEDYEQTLRT